MYQREIRNSLNALFSNLTSLLKKSINFTLHLQFINIQVHSESDHI